MTQKQQVLNYIDMFGSITQLEAIRDLGIMRLASRVSDLKRDGHNIKKTMVKNKNRFGKTIHYAKYEYEKENENAE